MKVFGTMLWAIGATVAVVISSTGAIVAQEQAAPAATITLSANSKNEAAEFTASDISFFLSEVLTYDGTPATSELSLSLSGVGPLTAALLEWSTRKPEKGAAVRDVTIAVTFNDTDGKEREMVYELTEARVTSFSISHSSYANAAAASLQVAAKGLRINGVAMN